MSILLLAAVIAAQKQREQQYYHKKHSSSSKKKKNSSSTTYSYGREKNYFDYLEQEVAERDSKLGEFFQMIEKEYKEEIQREYQLRGDKFHKIQSDIEASIPAFHLLIDQLKEKGITINHIISDKTRYKTPSIHISEIGNIFFQNYEELIQALKDKLSSLESSQKIKQQEKDKIQEQIMIASKKAKYAIFNRSSKRYVLQDLESKFTKLDEEYQYYSKLVQMIQIILSMSKSEKGIELLSKSVEELNEAFELKDSLITAGKEYRDFGYYCNFGYSYHINAEVLENVFEKLLEEGKISEITLQKIFLLMDTVEIKGRRGEYEFYSCYSDYGHSDLSKSIMKWFVKNIYEMDDDFVARNIVLEEENDKQEEQDYPKTLKYNQ